MKDKKTNQKLEIKKERLRGGEHREREREREREGEGGRGEEKGMEL